MRLLKVFIRPEDEASRNTLIKYMEQILFGLNDFLKKHVGITESASLKELSMRFTDTVINEKPVTRLSDVITCIINELAPHAVNVSSPYFVGHMTSAIPFFMVHLKTIVAALNQNVVKLETSKVLSILEKQVIAKIHRLIYEKSEEFYLEHVQNTETSLGVFTEGGTTANLTALWVARNTAFPPKDDFKGIESDGLAAAFRAHDTERGVILVSRLGHYSLKKAAGILGLGNNAVIPIATGRDFRIDMTALKKTISDIRKHQPKTRILAIIGIAGATETGTIDPLPQLADICEHYGIHFHVDAAWGGPTLLSEKNRHLLTGIKRADSVTIDGHKQFYMPMSCGMVYFKNPRHLDTIAYHANYVNRPGSVDLGIKSLSGSREANSLILDAALKIMGKKGYSLLIDHGIETAALFADEIEKRPDFQLVTRPVLNILTYRYFPEHLQKRLRNVTPGEEKRILKLINRVNRDIQRIEREAGKSFVSRTTLTTDHGREYETVVLRCVIMNPMTTIEILREILDEQEEIGKERLSAGT